MPRLNIFGGMVYTFCRQCGEELIIPTRHYKKQRKKRLVLYCEDCSVFD